MRTKFPTFFLSHGGGPWPWMREEYGDMYLPLAQALAAVPAQLGATPDALLVVTAHWETPDFMVSSGDAPGMIYDYGGFPPHTYQIRYPAPGDPALARRVAELCAGAGIRVGLDPQRGFDHGTFSMLAPIYPDADIPVVQLSLRRGLDPAEHLALGRVLAPLRSEGIAILGSGLSYHNLRAFGGTGAQASHAFDGWLRSVMALPPAQRREALLAWESAPAARLAHPREEHLLPLFVALGAAEDEPAHTIYHEDSFFGALAVSSFRFA